MERKSTLNFASVLSSSINTEDQRNKSRIWTHTHAHFINRRHTTLITGKSICNWKCV